MARSADGAGSAARVFEAIWKSRNAASMLLYPLSLVYLAVIGVRRVLYRVGLFARYRAPVPVIVVGNISVGGNGKTPFTIWLAKWLASRGLRPGIVLRGYRGDSPSWPLRVTPGTPASTAGDEAVLLARKSGVPVVAGPDRGADCRLLLESSDCDVIISDDGLQHLALARDYELALDDRGGHGNGWCLPAGPLREPRGRLREADQIVIYGDENTGIAPRVERAYRLANSRESRALREFAGDRILAITAIARPQRFVESLASQGLRVEHRVFPDHHVYSPDDIAADGYDAVMVTEKDAVKLSGYASGNLWVVALELTVAPEVIGHLEQSLLPLLEIS